jgi:type VI secretion system protein VasD
MRSITRLHFSSHFSYAIFFTIALLLCGCSSGSSKSKVGGVLNLDTDLKINFIVDSTINPDDKKRPSPVFIRLYELKSPAIFNKADFLDLYERDKEILADDFVSKLSLKALTPAVGRTDTLILKSGASYVALYAEFSQYRGSVYKLSFPVTENNVMKNEVTVKISGTEMALVGNEKQKKKQTKQPKREK